ncbi:unnamed protein product [Linum tenue]|uniref:Uncharacterized protein n=1 Tax=Linum tenue TaxID=586396 RepID=A0AAV0QAG3_9ROSI|nr:unnamed protein product [Linum tenue]CAI0389482.1 unnamed protein product [Linum tenue]CAI0427230.1 unnamed protein product [Linum tenue]CAI0541831.1 unnamed protein product [Linum tenue]
MEKGDSLFQL